MTPTHFTLLLTPPFCPFITPLLTPTPSLLYPYPYFPSLSFLPLSSLPLSLLTFSLLYPSLLFPYPYSPSFTSLCLYKMPSFWAKILCFFRKKMVLKVLKASFCTFSLHFYRLLNAFFSKLENVNTFKLEVLAVVRFEIPN